MGKTLVIAEKPSVGRDIARVLGCRAQGDGCLLGEDYIVSWALGHLVTLAEPEDYDASYKKWSRNTLPILPDKMKLVPIQKTAKQLKVLQKLMKDKEVDRLICATDSGREGELIFRYIYQYHQCRKPFQRLWISSMTDKAISDGFATLKESAAYDDLYLSAKCRAEADWLVGINATRAYSLQYDVLLSIGRVQTPTLAIIVRRQEEIDAFVPTEYFEVAADFGLYTGLWWNEKDNTTRLSKKEDAQAIVQAVRGGIGQVASIEVEEKKQLPPLLYDLTELQRDCNKRFGFSAQKTLSIAQSLYETKKRITYPRTDSRYLSDDMIPKLSVILKKVQAGAAYAPYTAQILTQPKLPISKRIIDNSKVSDHHAIIPTEAAFRTDNLSADEAKVYDLVVRRFLAVFFPEYKYAATKVVTRVQAYPFLSRGTMVLQEGWTVLYKGLEDTEKKEKETALPPLEKGQEYPVKSVKSLQKKTTPPKPYTEAGLLSAMENAGRFVEDEALKEQMKDAGLGTPATRAAIIERLLTVGYIRRKGKSLIPTEKGVKLISIVPEEMRSPETTGKWEKGLSSIAKGKMQPERFMQSIQRYVQFLVQDSSQKKAGTVFTPETKKGRRRLPAFGPCPLCKEGDVWENSKAFYCSNWRRGCSFKLWKDSLAPYGAALDGEVVRALLEKGKVENLPVSLPQTGEKGTATLVFRADFQGVELKNRSPAEPNQEGSATV